jgi:methanogenic corrinoid protein MtbC1
MRRAFNKPASVMIAGTHPINTTYDKFHIIERDVPFQPDSMRISGFQSHMAARLNERRVQFTSEEIESAYQEIIQKIEGDNHSKVIVNKPKQIKEVKGVSYN